MLTDRTDIERKVNGAAVGAFLAYMVLAAVRYFAPEQADALGPMVEPAVIAAATWLAGYFTRSRAVP